MLNQTEKITKDLDGILAVLAILIAFFLPLNQKIVVLLIVITGLFSVLSWIKKGVQLPKKSFWPFPIIFIIYLIGLFFTTNFDYGWHDIETRMTFILFPLFYGLTKRDTHLPIRTISIALVVGCVLAIGFAYYYAGICFVEYGYQECYEGVRLAYNMHPTYLSLYMIIALAFLWFSIPFKTASIGLKIVMLLVSFVLLFMVYRLYSLGPWIGLMGMTTALIITYTILKKKLRLALIGTTILLIAMFVSVKTLPFLKADFDSVKNKISLYFENPTEFIELNKNEINSVDSRIVIWMTSIEFIKAHPFGVGTGDMRDELLGYYRQKGMTTFAERELNPHCQYLQTSISIGLIGSLFLIASFVYFLIYGLKRRNYYLIALIALFATASLFESLLERQWGVVFFMFFLSVLLEKDLVADKSEPIKNEL